MKKSTLSILTGFCMLVLTSACINHGPHATEVEESSERRVVGTKYYVTLAPSEPVVDTQFKATINKSEHFEINHYETIIEKDYYIPYSGWRKLYEIPTGFVLLPCSAISHVGWLFCLGLWNYDFTWNITCKSFAGMNPFINWETQGRMQANSTTSDKKLVKTETETKEALLKNSTVTLKAGRLSKAYKTDEFGSFEVHLFSLKPEEIFFPLDRQISFYPIGSGSGVYDIVLKREFVSKLNSARDLINTYNLAPTGKKLYETTQKLEEFGFTRLAYELESQELKKHANDSYFKESFTGAGGIWLDK